MNVEYINPFLESINEVFSEWFPQSNMRRDEIHKHDQRVTIRGCASIISITGEVEGRIILDMSLETAVSLATEMLGDEYETFNLEVSSAINEIANMISGRAISKLSNSGKDPDISAPTLFTGMQMELFDSDMISEGIVILLATEYGALDVYVAINDKPD